MKLVIRIFGSIGLVMLALSVYLFFNQLHFIQSAAIGEGRVIELQRRTGSKGGSTYAPVVEYTTNDGRKVVFHSTVSSNPPAFEVDEIVPVYYEPGNPNHAEVKAFFTQWLLVLITGIFGIIFSGIGIGVVLAQRVNKRKIAYLQQHGRRIRATVTSIEQNTSTRVNGRSPYVIYAQWLNPQTNQMHVFKSDSIWYNPTELIAGSLIDVWMDERNPKKYYVDITFLPKVVQ